MMRRVLIDADGCPVVDEAVATAVRFGAQCLILCDTAHRIEKEGAETYVCSKGADSVDFTLVNMVKPGDIVVTQDYGLAAMCLARRARVLSQNGMEYTDGNIDSLLYARHTARKIRNGGGRVKGPKKRTFEQDQQFLDALTALLRGEWI